MGKAFVFKMNGTDFELWNLYQNWEARLLGFAGVAEWQFPEPADLLAVFSSLHDGFN